jgi:hypothetical protein
MGRIVSRRRPPAKKELNKGPCPECKAQHGETCYRMTKTQFIELRKTHRTLARERKNARKAELIGKSAEQGA